MNKSDFRIVESLRGFNIEKKYKYDEYQTFSEIVLGFFGPRERKYNKLVEVTGWRDFLAEDEPEMIRRRNGGGATIGRFVRYFKTFEEAEAEIERVSVKEYPIYHYLKEDGKEESSL